MMAIFLKDGDSRLEKVSDFEIQTISTDDKIIDIDFRNKSTFNAVFEELDKRYQKGLEISVLDYGGDLQATVTPIEDTVKHHYLVLMD